MQHSKCCVVSQPPWVQIPALPPLPPGPIGAGRFCYARKGVSACECCLLLLVAPLVFRAPEAPAAVCAGGRRPAREARRPHCVRRRASKPAHALRSLRRPPHQWGWVTDVCLCVVSKPGIGCQSAISHVIPVSLFQLLNLYRWNCNVFVRSQKMTEINYVRHLSGACLTVARGAPQLGLPIPPHRQQWGFYAMRSPLTACRRRVGALDGVISPDW